MISDLGTGFTDQWDYAQRPLRPNARVVALDQVDLRDFDFALLHFDENVLATHNTNGVIGQDWSASFKWAMQNLDMPKVAICHGTPQFYGQYDANYAWGDLGVVIEEERRRLVDYLDDVPVVCNSHQAAREWGFRNSRVIWQGFDPVEFQLSSYNRGALALGRAMSERPHYRGDFLFQEVARLLGDDYPIERLQVREPDLLVGSGDNIFAAARFRSYVDAIRNYSVYVNTTLRSPMPRSRGEAMLCGLATVTARNHDVEMFITNGYDGFYAEQADELAEYVRYLIDNPEQARKIGMRGRLLSADLFNHDRFLGEWHRLINSLVG